MVLTIIGPHLWQRLQPALAIVRTTQSQSSSHLHEAGIPRENLRLIIMRENATGEDHAVVAARVDGRWHILDNRFFVMVEDTDINKYKPVFAIDAEGIKTRSATGNCGRHARGAWLANEAGQPRRRRQDTSTIAPASACLTRANDLPHAYTRISAFHLRHQVLRFRF